MPVVEPIHDSVTDWDCILVATRFVGEDGAIAAASVKAVTIVDEAEPALFDAMIWKS